MKVERVRVGDVLALQRREVAIEPDEHYRRIGIYSFGKGIFHRDAAPGAELGNYRFYAIEPGDLVLSNIQAWEGAIGLAMDVDAGTIGTHRFLSYAPTTNRIDANWARWFFLSEPGMDLIRHAAPGTMMRNRTLAIDRFEALEIPLPTVDEQRRVAARLDLVEGRRRQISRLLTQSSHLLQALTTSLVLRACREASEALFSDLFSLCRRSVDVELATTYREIGIRSFGKGIFHKPPVYGAELGSKRVFEIHPGDLVISNVFGWEGALAVASAQERRMIGSHRFMTWQPASDEIDPQWAALYLTTPEGMASLQSASPGSAGRNRTLAIDRLKEIVVKVPPPERQREVVRTVQELGKVTPLASRIEALLNAAPPAVANGEFAKLS